MLKYINFININELLGYIASVIVAISLMMNSVIKLRLLNLLGSLFFSIYGFIIHSLPVGFLNLFICIVNIYYLAKMGKTSEYFSLFEVSTGSEYMKKFIEFYEKDLIRFFPYFNSIKNHLLSKNNDIHYYFILRDLIPAGLLITEKKQDHFYIHLDYVIPAYRDFRIARFLFIENVDYFINKGYEKMITHSGHNLHASYLKKIGFNKIGNDNIREIYEINLIKK